MATEIQDVEIEPTSNANTRVALAVALLASFVALANIKAGNVNETMLQAQAERNNSWAWYQAVRVREDMATYQLSNLQRRERDLSNDQPQRSAELTTVRKEIADQTAEIERVRARLDETRTRAESAEKTYAFNNAIGDQYDFADAMIAIAITVLAVSTLANVGWLFWFALIPGAVGVSVGAAAMWKLVLPMREAFALLG